MPVECFRATNAHGERIYQCGHVPANLFVPGSRKQWPSKRQNELRRETKQQAKMEILNAFSWHRFYRLPPSRRSRFETSTADSCGGSASRA